MAMSAYVTIGVIRVGCKSPSGRTMVEHSSQGPEEVAVNREDSGRGIFVRAIVFIVRIAT